MNADCKCFSLGELVFIGYESLEGMNARDIAPLPYRMLFTPEFMALGQATALRQFLRRDGSLVGVEAVIDKDLASALLARTLKADALLLLTDVDAVYADWETSQARAIHHTSPQALRELASLYHVMLESQMAMQMAMQQQQAGQMRDLAADLPKVQTPWEQLLRTQLARGLAIVQADVEAVGIVLADQAVPRLLEKLEHHARLRRRARARRDDDMARLLRFDLVERDLIVAMNLQVDVWVNLAQRLDQVVCE